MILPTFKFVYDRKKTATSTKEASVELRISHERKSKYISTGIRLLPKHWRGYVTNRADAAELNEALDLILSRVRKIANTMIADGKLDINEIPSRLACATAEKQSFIDFCEQRAQIRMYGKKDDTMERYFRFLRWLRSWGVIVWFSDVTDTNIIRMDKELAATGMRNYSKWNNYHRFMNSFILDAIDDGYLRRNPYKWLHIAKDRTTGIGKYLSPEELEKVEKAVMPTKSLERVRDLFVFQTYTCMSYTDLASFKIERAEEKNGVMIYTSKRGKTSQEFTFVLLDKAMAVLNKYKKRLPLLSNVKYNEYLKIVVQAAGVDQPLITSHWARHTGATLLLNSGVDMEVVAKILGHASTKQTRQTYAKLLDETIIREMQKVEKKEAPETEATES